MNLFSSYVRNVIMSEQPKCEKILNAIKASDPNLLVYVFSIVIPILCFMFTLASTYLSSKLAKSSALVSTPIFENLIALRSDDSSKYELDVFEQLFHLSENINARNHVTAKAPESEVHNTLQAALAFKYAGKEVKAKKLFEHAAAIAPNDPDVLTHYGEFLEEAQRDVVGADTLYARALVLAPRHAAALERHRRTSQVVDAMDLELLSRIDQKRDQLRHTQLGDDVREEVYYLHIYHTVGIEGNTLTLEQLRYLLTTGRAVAGKSIVEHNEVLGLQLAMKYVKLLTRGARGISLADILGIHRRVMGYVEPLSSGTLRTNRVFVGGHAPPEPDRLPALMDELIEWLSSEDALGMHPVRQAALAHYKLVDIHPFTDGNGRTARLLMNLILLRAGYPPVIVFKEQRATYYQSLKLANQGDLRPFVRFIAESTDHILDVYLQAHRLARLPETTSRTIDVSSPESSSLDST